MSVKYEVTAVFTIANSKPQLVSVTLHSSTKYCQYLVGSDYSFLSHSRFFYTQKAAKEYIGYLFSRYPSCPLAMPVLDTLQHRLF